MKNSGSQNSKSPSQLINARIEELGDWRGEMLSRLRSLVKEADPEIVEEWKWRGVPVWEHDGIKSVGVVDRMLADGTNFLAEKAAVAAAR